MKINYKIAVLAIVLGFLMVENAHAAEFLAPAKNADPNVSVPANEIKKNLYTSGASVTLNGDILGDVYVAGGTVSLVGNIEQDANILGGSLSVVGAIGGDVRIAGGNINITGKIGGDLLLAGGNVTLSEKSAVGGDLVIGGGNVVLDAPVQGDLKIAGGNVTINSKVSGDVWVANNQSLTFGPRAEVVGKITHKGQKEAVVKEGAKISAIQFEKIVTQQKNFRVFSFGSFVLQILALFIIAWLFLQFRKKGLLDLFQITKSSPWGSLGLGLAGFILIPITFVLLLVTFVGYYLAIVLCFSYILLLLLAYVASSLLLGNYIMLKIFKREETVAWKVALLGVVAWKVLWLIPVLGWLVGTLLFLVTLGGSIKIIKQRFIQN